MVNKPLLRKVMEHIEAHPEEHDQGVYAKQTPCGTVGCVAGHAVLLAGWDLSWEPTDEGVVAAACTRVGREPSWIDLVAQEELGLSYGEARYLFSVDRTLDEIRVFVTGLLESGG